MILHSVFHQDEVIELIDILANNHHIFGVDVYKALPVGDNRDEQAGIHWRGDEPNGQEEYGEVAIPHYRGFFETVDVIFEAEAVPRWNSNGRRSPEMEFLVKYAIE